MKLNPRSVVPFLVITGGIVTPLGAVSAAWMAGGILVSNVCRANINPSVFWVYPPVSAQPVGTACALPDGTPGTVTAS